MNRLLLITASILSIVSCSHERYEILTESQPVEVSLCAREAALRDFAILLSKAVYNEPELRAFIKHEALKKYDKDYDVFYPWVKNEEVVSGRTLFDILSKYDSNQSLDIIEQIVPMLTILVPDWTWVHENCFGPNKWNLTEDSVGVGYRTSSMKHEVFCNGVLDCVLDKLEFPSAPTLIVKENERMKIISSTKGIGYIFDYSDPEYNGMNADNNIRTKYYDEYHDYYLDYSTVNYDIPVSSLPYRLEGVLSETSVNNNLKQRDYLYYDMTALRDSGVVNNHYKERLLKFKVNPNSRYWFDDTNNTDLDFDSELFTANFWGTSVGSMSQAQIQDHTWGEGALDFRIEIYGKNGLIHNTPMHVPFEDVFSVKKVRERTRYRDNGRYKSRYYYIGIDRENYTDVSSWVEPKWILLDNLKLFTWDISNQAMDYMVYFKEEDVSNTTTYQRVVGYTIATNFKTTVGAVIEILKLGYDMGASASYNESNTYTVTINEKDDDMGCVQVHYGDPIITAITGNNATLYRYNTQCVDFVVLPVYE